MEWLFANWSQIVQVYLGIVGVASIIVKLTPTVKDNEALEKVVKFMAKFISLNRTVNDDAIRAEK